jgi:hypothetical protein
MSTLDRMTLDRARLALRQAVRSWIYHPNVMLIDLGWPERGGQVQENEQLHIRVHVRDKYRPGPELEAAVAAGRTPPEFPQTIGGIPVDVPEGTYQLHQWFRPRRTRGEPRARSTTPMQGGISISNAYRYGYATLGGAVEDRDTGAPMILSNWHVLAGDWRARQGWPIYQPGRGDGGRSRDAVARLSHDAMAANLDAAVAELTGERPLINAQLGLYPVSGVGWAQVGMDVVKSGRRTGVTRGRVTAIDGVLRMNYRGVNRLIQHVITINPRVNPVISGGGDSGSFWIEEATMRAVGLHFAGSDDPERALAIDMQPILDELNVNLVI